LDLPVANTLVQIGITNANQLAQFSASLAGRSLSEQIQYLSSLGLPLSAAQSVAQSLSAIAGSLPNALGQLTSIDQSNTMYGLASDYQQPQVNLPAYAPGVPNVQTPRNYGSYGTTVNPGDIQPNQPAPVAPGQPQQQFDIYGNPMAPQQSNAYSPQQARSYFAQLAQSQANQGWDPTSEAIPQY
jgi:hypothetical protein